MKDIIIRIYKHYLRNEESKKKIMQYVYKITYFIVIKDNVMIKKKKLFQKYYLYNNVNT